MSMVGVTRTRRITRLSFFTRETIKLWCGWESIVVKLEYVQIGRKIEGCMIRG